MPAPAPARLAALLALATGALACLLAPAPVQALQNLREAAPSAPRATAPPSSTPHTIQPRGPLGHGPGHQHLSEWMNQHRELSPAEQQRALDREPGFRQLAPEVQQRMHNRLSELDNMPPAQRQRLLNRAEAMERLAPEQRQQVRGSMQQLSTLAPEQRLAVKHAFRQFRQLQPEQRQAALNSGALTNGLSPEERSTFNGLVSIEPLLPPPPSDSERSQH